MVNAIFLINEINQVFAPKNLYAKFRDYRPMGLVTIAATHTHSLSHSQTNVYSLYPWVRRYSSLHSLIQNYIINIIITVVKTVYFTLLWNLSLVKERWKEFQKDSLTCSRFQGKKERTWRDGFHWAPRSCAGQIKYNRKIALEASVLIAPKSGYFQLNANQVNKTKLLAFFLNQS